MTSTSLFTYAVHYIILRTLYDSAHQLGIPPLVLVICAILLAVIIWYTRRFRTAL
jgi:hypothetical protein